MNRRLFAAGVAAMAGTGTVAAQEATPDTDAAPREVLAGYITAIIRDGNMLAIPDYFDGDALDLDTVILGQADLLDGAHSDGDPVTVDVRVLLGDHQEAVALVEFWSNEYNTRAAFIAVRVRDGKIVGYRWMAHASERSS
jgi:hypothetical protein